jgi:hypothetical protein
VLAAIVLHIVRGESVKSIWEGARRRSETKAKRSEEAGVRPERKSLYIMDVDSSYSFYT